MSHTKKQLKCLLAPIIGSLSREEFYFLVRAIRRGRVENTDLGIDDLLGMYDRIDRDNAQRMAAILMARYTGTDLQRESTADIVWAISYFMDYGYKPSPAVGIKGTPENEAFTDSMTGTGVLDTIADAFSGWWDEYAAASVPEGKSVSLVPGLTSGAQPNWEYINQMVQGLENNPD